MKKTPRKGKKRKVPTFLFIGVEMRYNTPQHIDSEVAKLDREQYEVVSIPYFMEMVKKGTQNGDPV